MCALDAFMLIHIREKDPLQYNGWEQDVADRLKEGDFSFIPSNDAISLHEYNESTSRETDQLFDKVAALEINLKSTTEMVKSTSELVTTLAEQNERLLNLMCGTAGRDSSASFRAPAVEARNDHVPKSPLANGRRKKRN